MEPLDIDNWYTLSSDDVSNEAANDKPLENKCAHYLQGISMEHQISQYIPGMAGYIERHI